MNDVIEALAGQLVVSCQAYPGEPMRNPETMAQIAHAAQIGGCPYVVCQAMRTVSGGL